MININFLDCLIAIQGRIRSSRFQVKSLAEINSKKLILYVLETFNKDLIKEI